MKTTMTKRTERKPQAKSRRETGTGRQFKVGHVYPIELHEHVMHRGKHLHVEQKRIFKGSFELFKSVRERKTGTLHLYGQIIENGEDFVIVLGKGVPR
jgi:hypothetical protein